jgi:hypothetical protein
MQRNSYQVLLNFRSSMLVLMGVESFRVDRFTPMSTALIYEEELELNIPWF